MLGSAPYILVIGHVFTVVVIGLVRKLVGGIQNTGSYSRLFLPFSPTYALFFSLERLTLENSGMTYLQLFQTIPQNLGTSLLIHNQRSGKSECELAKKSSH